jgi:hypothetical protein
MYKKSTENLFNAPPVKNMQSSSNNVKYNMWKAKTSKFDIKATKPPKYSNKATFKRN